MQGLSSLFAITMIVLTVTVISPVVMWTNQRCITHFKVHAETGNHYYAGQNPQNRGTYPILRILLKNGVYYNFQLTGSKPRGTIYTKEFAFSPSSCVTREDIKEVQLKAGNNGNDGWNIASINTFTATENSRKIRDYNLLTTDPGFSMWIDADEADLYPYDATQHRLTLLKG